MVATLLVWRSNCRTAAGGLEYQREPTEQWGYDKLMAALREKLTNPEIEKLVAEGAAWSEDQAVEEALKV